MVESPTKNEKQERSRPQRRQGRRWLFRLGAICVALAVFPLIEGILRLCNAGPNVNLVIPIRLPLNQDAPYTHQFNGSADLPFFGRTDVAGPEERPFQNPRPADTYRIVVLGGSTVIGFPYSSTQAFPRHIECQLSRQNPDVTFEVLNAGITSMNSFAVNDLVSQCVAAEPDLIVVHTGHNEFYGPGGPASTAFQLSPELIRRCYQLRRWRSVQLATELFQGKEGLDDDLLDILPRELSVPIDGPVYQQAGVNYESNLRLIAESCDRAGIPLLMTTVACNLRDQSPLLSIWPRKSRDGTAEWNSLLIKAKELIEREQYAAALKSLDEAATIVSEHADLSYRRGQCFHGLGRSEDAYREFSRARDLDGCRFRIPSAFHEIPERIAGEFANCTFLNVAEAMKNAGAEWPLGHNVFLEHVHYNFEGHHLVGKIIANTIQTRIRDGEWQDDAAADVGTTMEILGFLPEDDLAATSFSIQVFETGPFSQTLDKEDHVKYLSNRAGQIFNSLPEERQQVFADLSMDRMSEGMVITLSEKHKENGDTEIANEMIRTQELRTPWMPR